MGFETTLSAAGVDANGILPSVQKRQFETGSCIIEQGLLNRNIYILTKGLIKLVYNTHSGAEFTKGFIEEGVIFASLTSTLVGEPSRFSAICLTSVELEQMPSRVFGQLTQDSPQMMSFANQMFRNLALRNEEREYDFLCLSASERYQKFMDNAPQIAKQLTQIEIAAYLGITPVALSRIRSRRTNLACQ